MRASRVTSTTVCVRFMLWLAGVMYHVLTPPVLPNACPCLARRSAPRTRLWMQAWAPPPCPTFCSHAARLRLCHLAPTHMHGTFTRPSLRCAACRSPRPTVSPWPTPTWYAAHGAGVRGCGWVFSHTFCRVSAQAQRPATTFLAANDGDRPVPFFVQCPWPFLEVMPAYGVIPPGDDVRVVVAAKPMASHDVFEWYQAAESVRGDLFGGVAAWVCFGCPPSPSGGGSCNRSATRRALGGTTSHGLATSRCGVAPACLAMPANLCPPRRLPRQA